MDKKEPVILRRLTTKDGVVGPIEEARYPSYSEKRGYRERITAPVVTGEEHYPDPRVPYPPIPCREYRQKKVAQAILIEMEEV